MGQEVLHSDSVGDDGEHPGEWWVYLPPHIILNETEMMRGDSRLKPLTFRPANQLPNPLPEERIVW